MPNHPIIKETNDGSHTLYSDRFRQHYHNPNGAVAESKHVFFQQNGLMEALVQPRSVNILEIGFGTGLNLLLLMDEYSKNEASTSIRYHSIEAFPISPQKAASLNYSEHLNNTELAQKIPPLFENLQKGLNRFNPLPNIEVAIFFGLFDDYSPDDLKFDFIFHDAFSPAVNPELWTGKVFLKLHQWSKPTAKLATYCAASKARGAMAWADWKVARATGALGKREMTIASPTQQPLKHLKRINEERLARRYEEGDFDHDL